MQKAHKQLALVVGLIFLGLCGVISLLSASNQKPSSLLNLVSRIHRRWGPRVTQLAGVTSAPEDLNHYLRASADSIAYSCGGKEVAEVCLLSTETCVASMQKKIQYTTEQAISRDLGTCSCFQQNGCSAGCNAAMQSMFGGYVSVADCPLDTSSYIFSGSNPYEMYGEDMFGSYNYPGVMYSSAGAYYKANPSNQMLAQVDTNEPVYLVSRARKLAMGRKI